ncbi:MAG: response regulator transcription factor, partial [Bacteroidaceae bacterium]|nr:response regulator transcription factor [Bacteroidaceae bacterium]
ALDQSERFLRRIPSIHLVGKFLTVRQAKETLQKEQIDLLFLDIDLPGCTGIEFAHSLEAGHPWVVFTTAYPQYAVDGFRVDAVDYLLKPLSFEELQDAVEKVKRRMPAEAPAPPSDPGQLIYVKANGLVRKLRIDEIIFIKGMSEYVQLGIRGENHLLTTHESIKHFESLLPAEQFMRIHKSYLINLNCIEKVDRTHVTLCNKRLPIGQTYRSALVQYIKEKLNKTCGTALHG